MRPTRTIGQGSFRRLRQDEQAVNEGRALHKRGPEKLVNKIGLGPVKFRKAERVSARRMEGGAALTAVAASVARQATEDFNKAHYPRFFRRIHALLGMAQPPTRETHSKADLAEWLGILYIAQHQCIAAARRLAGDPHLRREALSLLRGIGHHQSGLFELAVSLSDEATGSTVPAQVLFRNTMKSPEVTTEEQRRAYYEHRLEEFKAAGGDLSVIQVVSPEVVAGLVSGAYYEWVVTDGDEARLWRADRKPAPSHDVAAEGGDVKAAGSMRPFLDEEGKLSAVVIGTFSGHYRNPIQYCGHLGRHLQDAGVPEEILVYQGGAAATPRSVELAHLALGVASEETKRTLAFLEDQASQFNEQARVKKERTSSVAGNGVAKQQLSLDWVFGMTGTKTRKNHMLVEVPLLSPSEHVRSVIEGGADTISFSADRASAALALSLCRVRAVSRELGASVSVQLQTTPNDEVLADIGRLSASKVDMILLRDAGDASTVQRFKKQLEEKGFRGIVGVAIDSPDLARDLDKLLDSVSYVVVARRALGERIGWSNLPAEEARIHRACRLAGRPSVITLDGERIAAPASPAAIHSIYEAMVVDGARAVLMSGGAEDTALQVRALDATLHDMDNARFREAVLGKMG